MPHIALPNDQWADVVSAQEISERVFRRIDRARTKTLSTGVKLNDGGYEDNIPEDWDEAKRKEQASTNLKLLAGLDDEDFDAINNYQTELVVGMVKAWSYPDAPTPESVVELPKLIFDELAGECEKVLNATKVDTEPSIDPKAPAADSQD